MTPEQRYETAVKLYLGGVIPTSPDELAKVSQKEGMQKNLEIVTDKIDKVAESIRGRYGRLLGAVLIHFTATAIRQAHWLAIFTLAFFGAVWAMGYYSTGYVDWGFAVMVHSIGASLFVARRVNEDYELWEHMLGVRYSIRVLKLVEDEG